MVLIFIKMNFFMNKLCSHLLKCPSTVNLFNSSKNNSLRSSNNGQTIFVTRTVITRPKELDVLRRRSKERQEEKKNQTKDPTREETGYGPLGFLLISIPVISFGLGTWQIQRRSWKLNLIKDLEERMSREPVELPENLDDLAELEYCPIKIRGEFLHDKEFIVGPRSLIIDGRGATEGKGNLISGSSLNKGYNLITPFKVENRDLIILVNRGWLPHKFKSPEQRKKCQIEGTVELTGVNRLTEVRPQFVPKNEPERGIWHYRDIHQMAEFAGTEPVYLDIIESDLSPDMPIGSQTRVNLRNEHLSYIVTWYGISSITGYYCYRMFILKKPIF